MVFDTHCDTVFELYEQNKELNKNDLHLDIERMREYDTYIQVFAAFIDKKNIKVPPIEHCSSLIEKYHNEMNKGGILPILSLDDLKKAKEKGGAYSILAIEGGEALEGNLDALLMYYKMGVRLITLTWNYTNEISGGILEDNTGLTDFGKEAVKMMEKMGIIIDVSHISENGFWDVLENTKYPFVASHSCAKALCSHPRNLSDEQINAMIKRNCGVGINFYPEFLDNSGECSLDRIVDHIEYMLNLGGEKVIGLGSDFDGVPKLPVGMNGAEDMEKLFDIMKNRGINDEIIQNVKFENFYRIFYDALGRK